MAVLIEAISVVIRADALLAAFENEDDWIRFKQTVPNATLCADEELIRVGFTTPHDAEQYVRRLESNGLRFVVNGSAKDIVVVDQLRGPTSPCDWIEFGSIPLNGDERKRVAACRLKGSTSNGLILPDGWTFESSLSCSHSFVPSDAVDKALKFLRSEDGMDVYWSELSGKEVYIARTSGKPE